MPETLTIKTSGIPVISKKQAEYFAILIFPDVKACIKICRKEFEQSQENSLYKTNKLLLQNNTKNKEVHN